MVLDKLVKSITPEIYKNLKYAVETGRWPNGEPVSDPQREQCLQAIIAYDHLQLPESERVGYIDRAEKSKGELCEDEWQDLPVLDPKNSA
jgi:uncharacterized protein YeaC (DUF1315 family)